MARARYIHVSKPWQAVLDADSDAARAHYAGLIDQSLRVGLPAARPLGVAWSVMARRGLPERLIAGAVKRFPRARDEELDELRARLTERWGALAELMPELGHGAPETLALLAIERSAGRVVFVFGTGSEPLLVAKLPRTGHPGAEREVDALKRAAGAEIAPRHLGELSGAPIQQALKGRSPRVAPLRAAQAGSAPWPDALGQITGALTRLATDTRTPGRPEELDVAIEPALESDLLSDEARRRLSLAWSRLQALSSGVLRHGDTSAQNYLFCAGRLQGLVDWEEASPVAMPGFDALNAVVAYQEHGLGLVRWSQEAVVEAFRESWWSSPFWREGRAAGVAAAVAGGVAEDLTSDLVVAFFGHRVFERLEEPATHPTTAQTTARMLDVVCSAPVPFDRAGA